MCPNLIYEDIQQSNTFINPYEDFCYEGEIKCDYCIPTPDLIASLSSFCVPPPTNETTGKYSYTLKSGKKLELDHPLPPGFPIDLIPSDEEEHANNGSEDSCISIKHLLLYGTACICPISGIIMYAVLHKRNPKLANRIRKLTLTSFIAIGSFLLLLL